MSASNRKERKKTKKNRKSQLDTKLQDTKTFNENTVIFKNADCAVTSVVLLCSLIVTEMKELSKRPGAHFYNLLL